MNVIRSFDMADMSPHDAAALFWYIRNSLYFDCRLDELNNVLPLAYEDLVDEPRITMQGICRFVDCRFSERMIRNIHAKSVGRERSNLREDIQSLCFPLYDKLHEIQVQRLRALKLSG